MTTLGLDDAIALSKTNCLHKNFPQHIAVIMDGKGCWANKQGRSTHCQATQGTVAMLLGLLDSSI